MNAQYEKNLPDWVITRPKITHFAETKLTESAKSILSTHPKSYQTEVDGKALIEFGGRNCYESHHNPVDRTTDGYIENIVKQKHFSVIEHVNVSFFIEGVSRSFSHELIRHRHHSYSQLSQRYVDSTNARFVLPPLYTDDAALSDMWIEHINVVRDELATHELRVKNTYPDLPVKQIREAVRSIAPNCIETKLLVTGNLRAWREFLEKRWNSHADKEIQVVAEAIVSLLKMDYGSIFADLNYT